MNATLYTNKSVIEIKGNDVLYYLVNELPDKKYVQVYFKDGRKPSYKISKYIINADFKAQTKEGQTLYTTDAAISIFENTNEFDYITLINGDHYTLRKI